MALKLPRLTHSTPIIDSDNRPTRELTRFWDRFATAIEGGLRAVTSGIVVAVPGTGEVLTRVLQAGGPGIAITDGDGIAGNPIIAVKPGYLPRGFGIFAGTGLAANECLGIGQFPVAMTFINGDADTFCASEFAATASAVIHLKTWIGPPPGTRTTVGTIIFAAGSASGTLAWSASPFTLPAETLIEIYAPSPPDATLAWISCNVNGGPA